MNANTSNNQEYTFSKLLKDYDKILVPMIQRDYAQGRPDKKATDVRNNLLNDIFSGNDVHFDLVFGSKEKRIVDGKEMKCFIPVDGQQRLTTLFLLCLYGQKTGKSDTDLDLSKFSYDTRRAASDFCKSVSCEKWSVPNDKNVSEVIKDSSWFMDYWAKDPTVEGMLNMLDAIHENAKDKEFPDLEKVKFYFFDLDSNGLNENLYLKMNSRGKPLTAFENLKAKIEKVLPDNIEVEEKYFPKRDNAPKNNFKDQWKYFMDRDWTEAFWDSETPEEYDESITKFIVRFLSGYWAAYSKDEEETIANELKSINSDENYSDFIPFEPIKKVLCSDKDAFLKLSYALTTIIDNSKIKPYWSDEKEVIKVSDKSKYKVITVVFTYVLFDDDKDTMRFAWNMAENYVYGYDTFVSCCKRIKKIYDCYVKDSLGIYHTLAKNEFDDGNLSEQLREEIAKAQQILDVNGKSRRYEGKCKKKDGSAYKTWEEIIIEAEKYAFFKGAIRFLFTKENVGDDWEHFDNKWKNAQEYFDENGAKDGSESNKKYRTNALLLKSLLANCDNFGMIWWYFEFSNDEKHWKRILTSNDWLKSVNAIMCTNIDSDVLKRIIDKITDDRIKNIVSIGLLDFICNNMPESRLRDTYHNYLAIWQSGYPKYQVVLNPILSKLEEKGIITYRDVCTIENCKYYKCQDYNLDFKYNLGRETYYFQWWGSPDERQLDVYLMKDDKWEIYKERETELPNIETEEASHYCFRVTPEMEEDTTLFTKQLDKLIKVSNKE